MPRASSITTEILAEIARRRREGEAWKVIAADLRARGVPASRTRLWMVWRDVHERRDACGKPSGCATP